MMSITMRYLLAFYIYVKKKNKHLPLLPMQEHRLQEIFYVHSSDLESYKLSLFRFGAKLWNEITCHIRHLSNNKFKKTLRKLLFDILNSE